MPRAVASQATRTRTVAIIATLAMGAALSGTARAQSYGPGDQVLTIGAAKFRPESGEQIGWLDGSDGYLHARSPLIPRSPTRVYYQAPVPLPIGARITRLCMWIYDLDDGFDLNVSFRVVKLIYGGESASEATVGAKLSSSLAPGYRSYCEDVDLRLTEAYDVDGDGTLDPVAWYLRLDEAISRPALGFGGVRITWGREVSDAPGTPSFADVPDTHPFYQFIEELSASGITGGCGVGIFCPEAPLTRGQMAVFLAKALGLHWTD